MSVKDRFEKNIHGKEKTMKFLHLGDLHLGKSLNEFDLMEDQKYMLDQILQIIQQEAVEGVLIAGDVYDKSIPSEAATRLLDYFLCSLSALSVKTFIISGNHDSEERLHFGSSLFAANQIYICAKYNGELYKKTIEDAYGKIDVYLLPFVKASTVRHFYPDAKVESYHDAVRVILENASIDPTKRNVLVAHQFVAGKGEDPILAGSESVGTQSVGLVEKIGYDCFDAFDYTALGHIHSPQKVGREEVRYSGSMLKYSLSEVNNEKSVPIINIAEKGKVEITLKKLTPLRDLRHIKGPMSALLDPKNIRAEKDYMYVTLTDEQIQSDAMAIFQQVYPNTVKIDYENSRTKELDQVDIFQRTQEKSFEELFDDFYHMIYGCEMEEEERAVMKVVAQEAGVIDETN